MDQPQTAQPPASPPATTTAMVPATVAATMPPTVIDAPVVRVLVMEDRAQVERAGELEIGAATDTDPGTAGAGALLRLEVRGVSPLAVGRSLKCEVTGARLVDVALVRAWRERPRGGLADDASELRRRERALEDQRVECADELSSIGSRRELLATVRADLLRSIAEAAGAGRADVAAWGEQLDSLTALLDESAEAWRKAYRREGRVADELAEVRSAIATAEEPEQDLECSVRVTLERPAPGSRVRIVASYVVPCAAWRPAYRATLDGARDPGAGGARVRVEAEAVVWQRSGEPWNSVALSLSTARPTLGTAPPSLVEDRIATRPKAQQEKQVVQVSLREQEIQSAGEPSSGSKGATERDPELPGVDDGGEARLLLAPGPRTIPSDGQPHRVPLFAFEAPAELERLCPSELTPLVSLVARLANTSSEVLLAGPVDLIPQSGFVGRAQLKFTAPGEPLKLSFGSEDGLGVVRSVDEEQDESRLTGRRTTKRTVKLFVSNASPEAAQVVLCERVPVSEVKEVTVQVLAKECRPAPSSVSPEGIARLVIDLPPRGTFEARLVWELSAASKVAGV